MREVTGDLWAYDDGQIIARVITTNGFVKANGSAVLGAGVAKQAVERFGNGLAVKVGEYIERWGNHLHAFPPNADAGRDYWLVTLPVKPERGPNGEPGFKAKAQIDLIRRSCQELLAWAISISETGTIVLPRPGCGNGGLDWSEVRPVVEETLDQRLLFSTGYRTAGDRFVICEVSP